MWKSKTKEENEREKKKRRENGADGGLEMVRREQKETYKDKKSKECQVLKQRRGYLVI